jgi:hypothetical protein
MTPSKKKNLEKENIENRENGENEPFKKEILKMNQ